MKMPAKRSARIAMPLAPLALSTRVVVALFQAHARLVHLGSIRRQQASMDALHVQAVCFRTTRVKQIAKGAQKITSSLLQCLSIANNVQPAARMGSIIPYAVVLVRAIVIPAQRASSKRQVFSALSMTLPVRCANQAGSRMNWGKRNALNAMV
jgi:hypothetical protein